MRDLRRVERNAVIQVDTNTTFFPLFKQTIITTQRQNGRIVCRIERKIKFSPCRKRSTGAFSQAISSPRIVKIKEASPMKGGVKRD